MTLTNIIVDLGGIADHGSLIDIISMFTI